MRRLAPLDKPIAEQYDLRGRSRVNEYYGLWFPTAITDHTWNLYPTDGIIYVVTEHPEPYRRLTRQS